MPTTPEEFKERMMQASSESLEKLAPKDTEAITSHTEYGELNERHAIPETEAIDVPETVENPLSVEPDTRLNKGVGDHTPLSELDVPEVVDRDESLALHPEAEKHGSE